MNQVKTRITHPRVVRGVFYRFIPPELKQQTNKQNNIFCHLFLRSLLFQPRNGGDSKHTFTELVPLVSLRNLLNYELQ